jgi:hypothetical protein
VFLLALQILVTDVPLTDAQVQAAIAAGHSGKYKGCKHEIATYKDNGSAKPGMLACTPAGRIAQDAEVAKEKLMEVTPVDFGPESRADFTVHSWPPARMNLNVRAVQKIVLRDLVKVEIVQPISSKPETETKQNAYGAQVVLTSMVARFKMEDVSRLLEKAPKKREIFVSIVTDGGTVDYKVTAKDLGL